MKSARDEIIETMADAEQALRKRGANGKGFIELLRNHSARTKMPRSVFSPAHTAGVLRNRAIHEAANLTAAEMDQWRAGIYGLQAWLRDQAPPGARPQPASSIQARSVEPWMVIAGLFAIGALVAGFYMIQTRYAPNVPDAVEGSGPPKVSPNVPGAARPAHRPQRRILASSGKSEND